MSKIKSTVSKMENIISISFLNDFIFCPVSIYFHNLYGTMDEMLYQSKYQLNGKNAHKTIDNHVYTTKKSIITGMGVYSDKYKLIGKIDIYDELNKTLIERKKKINAVYDGFIFQMYAQYFCMLEMGYPVEVLKLYSMDDNKTYLISLPEDDPNMYAKFLNTIKEIQNFDMDTFVQANSAKCAHCIYAPACDRGVL